MSAVEALLNLAPSLSENAKYGPNHVMVCCPFHKERTPSCSISLIKPVFFCHACGASGHLAEILARFGMSRESIDIILPKDHTYTRSGKSAAERISRGEDPFKGFYVLDETLLDTYRMAPRALLSVGFTKDTLRHFEVGYDHKNLRITYPLRNAYGDLVGISGRTIIESMEPRYKIYDKELIGRKDFHVPEDYSMESVKSAVLWHAHIVRPFFFQKHDPTDFIAITEGFKACMWTYQSGYQDVAALVGSYLTELHAELICRVVNKVVLFLDNNPAGWKGTHKAARRLMRRGVDPYVALYPDDRQQPDALEPSEVADAIDYCVTYKEWSQDHEFVYEDASRKYAFFR